VSEGYTIARIDELETIPVGTHGLQWRPIRSRLGIRPFGMNAYTSAEVGGEVVEEHTELTFGHEEVYVVIAGHARFTLDGEEVDAPAGTIVHLPDPSVKRTAVSLEPDTTVLAVGGKPGEAYQPSVWELYFRASKLPPEEALELVENSEGYNVQEPGYSYNLACFRALAGKREEAVEAFRAAYEKDPERVSGWADGDTDLDSIRDEISAIAGEPGSGGSGA